MTKPKKCCNVYYDSNADRRGCKPWKVQFHIGGKVISCGRFGTQAEACSRAVSLKKEIDGMYAKPGAASVADELKALLDAVSLGESDSRAQGGWHWVQRLIEALTKKGSAKR